MKFKRIVNKKSIENKGFNGFILIILLISIGFIFLMIKYKNTEIKIYAAFFFIVLASFFLAMLRSRNLNNTMCRLRKYAELIEDLNEKNEIENNYHTEQLKNVEKEKLIKETQLSALQSQLDPHFLFNTLNTISRMAMFEQAEQTVKLIEATSKILRYNLDCKDKMVKLKEEILMTKAYVIIQETRFQDQMSFNFDIDKDIDTVKIPPMLIQPIVENAIIHGLREKDKGGIINITVKKQNDFISISIKDNGTGIDNEKINILLSEVKNESMGLGVFNVKKRLELYFNRNDLLKIKSQRGEGTEVIIFLPINL